MFIYFAVLDVLHRRFQLYQSDVHSGLTVRFTSLNLHLKNLPRLETFHHFVIKTEQKISWGWKKGVILLYILGREKLAFR